jgi:hypothetical protein
MMTPKLLACDVMLRDVGEALLLQARMNSFECGFVLGAISTSSRAGIGDPAVSPSVSSSLRAASP